MVILLDLDHAPFGRAYNTGCPAHPARCRTGGALDAWKRRHGAFFVEVYMRIPFFFFFFSSRHRRGWQGAAACAAA